MSLVDFTDEEIEDILSFDEDDEKPSSDIIIPDCLDKKIEVKIYTAIYNICNLPKKAQCKPHSFTIRTYLMGYDSVFKEYFKDLPYYGTVKKIKKSILESYLNKMVKKGVLYIVEGKKDSYYIK